MLDLNESELDRIFRAAGREQAPDGLHVAVMERILAQPEPVAVAPLISLRQGAWAALALAAALIAVWLLPGGPSAALATGPMERMAGAWAGAGQLLLRQLFWLAPAMGAALLFTLADRLLQRPSPMRAG